jgi:hypothetical protein
MAEGAVTVVAPVAEAKSPGVIEEGVRRLKDEFESLPPLTLNVGQVIRLLDMQWEDALDVLATLERDGFLIKTANGVYRRAQPPMA